MAAPSARSRAATGAARPQEQVAARVAHAAVLEAVSSSRAPVSLVAPDSLGPMPKRRRAPLEHTRKRAEPAVSDYPMGGSAAERVLKRTAKSAELLDAAERHRRQLQRESGIGLDVADTLLPGSSSSSSAAPATSLLPAVPLFGSSSSSSRRPCRKQQQQYSRVWWLREHYYGSSAAAPAAAAPASATPALGGFSFGTSRQPQQRRRRRLPPPRPPPLVVVCLAWNLRRAGCGGTRCRRTSRRGWPLQLRH